MYTHARTHACLFFGVLLSSECMHALHCITLHYDTIHYTTKLQYIALHFITFRYDTLRYYITLH